MEQADYEAARELFGVSALKPLDSYLPKTLREFEDFAQELVSRHVVTHRECKHYRAFLKALIRVAVEPLGPEDVKDVETCLAVIRSEKAKVGRLVQEYVDSRAGLLCCWKHSFCVFFGYKKVIVVAFLARF